MFAYVVVYSPHSDSSHYGTRLSQTAVLEQLNT